MFSERLELVEAMDQGKMVIPLLLADTPMPPAEVLPDELQNFAFINAHRLRKDPDFHRDIASLIDSMEHRWVTRTGAIPVTRAAVLPAASVPRRRLLRWLIPVGVVLLIAAIVAISLRGGDNVPVLLPAELRLAGHGGTVRAVNISYNATRAATAADDKLVRVSDLATSKEIGKLTASNVRAVSLTNDGRVLFVDSGAKLHSALENGTDDRVVSLAGVSNEVKAAAFLSGGGQLVAGLSDKTVRLYSLAGAELKRFEGQEKDIRGVAFSDDGSRVAVGSSDQHVRVWDVGTGQLVSTVDATVAPTALAISPDGDVVAVGDDTGKITLWEANSGRQRGSIVAPSKDVKAIAYSPVGELLVGGSDAEVRMIRVS